MKHAATQSLFAYWNRLRAGRAAPERAEIDPAEIRGVLADTFLLDVATSDRRQPYDVTIRLSGTRFDAIFDADVRDRPFSSLWRDADRQDLAAMVAAVLDDRHATVAGITAAPVGYVPVSCELLLLPLRHHGKTHARILGALTPGSIPSWLGLVGVKNLALQSWRSIGETDTATPAASEAKHEPRHDAPRRPADLMRRTSGTRRGHFVVFQGGRTDEAVWAPLK